MMITFTLLKRTSNTLRGFFTLAIMFAAFNFSWSQCANNNDDPPTLPIECGDNDGDGIDDCIFEIDFEDFIDGNFCIETDDGCAQVMITNIPTMTEGICPPQLVFTVGQGCGGATGNICYWADTDGDGVVDNIGGADGEMSICAVGNTMIIYACRPGNGPISIRDIRFEPYFDFPDTIFLCSSDLPSTVALPSAPEAYANGEWSDTNGNGIVDPANVAIDGAVGDCFTFNYGVNIDYTCSDSTCDAGGSVVYCIQECATSSNIECESTPEIICPVDFNGCPTVDITPGSMGFPHDFPSFPNVIDVMTCGELEFGWNDELVSNGINCNVETVTERTWFAHYELNPTDTIKCIQTIILVDNEVPTIEGCPENIEVEEGQEVTWSDPTITDNCNFSVETSHTSGAIFPSGCTTVVYTATDGCSNVSTCEFQVCVTTTCTDVVDIVCPADYIGCIGSEIDPAMTGSPVTGSGTEVATGSGTTACGNVNFTFVDEVISENEPCDGAQTITRTWTAFYDNNPDNPTTCTQNITLTDTEAPELSACPVDIALPAGTNIATWEAPIATDNCSFSLTSTHNSGDAFPIGCTPVTYTVTDACGNEASCSFEVCVESGCDAVPIIECPADYSACPGTSIDPEVTGNPTVTTTSIECGSIVTFFDSVAEEYAGCPGGRRIERTWVAKYSDNPTDSATCIQIIDLRDDQNPVITCPAGIALTSDNNIAEWVEPTVIDDCGATLSGTHTSGSAFPEGCTTVTYTATDNCGNAVSCSFQICVEEAPCTSVPIIECPADFTGCPGSSIDPANTGQPTVTATSAECGSIVTFFDVILEEYAGCNGGRRIQRTWSAAFEENPNNPATCIQIIDLNDPTVPTISCPSNISLTGGDNVATWTEPTVVDDCSTTLSGTHTSGATFEDGCTIVTYSATDICGNVAQCTFEVCVEGVDPCITPLIVTCPADYVGCPGDNINPNTIGVPTVSNALDGCGDVRGFFVDNIVEDYGCTGAVRIERTWEVAYVGYRQFSVFCTQIIDLRDQAAPVITDCPANITLTGGNTLATWSEPSFTDNCGASMSATHTSGSAFPEGCTNVTYTATDNCGNAATCIFAVCVEQDDCSTGAPSIICPPSWLGCPNTSIDPSVCGVPTVTSANPTCGTIVGYVDSEKTFFPECADAFRIERTWTVFYEDYPDQVTTCIQIIELNDNEAPVLSECPANITLTDGETVATWTTPTFTDNCGGTLSGTHTSGSSFPEGCTTVTYTAADNCGQSTSCTFQVCVESTCTSVPEISCPPSYFGCPGSSIDPDVCGRPTVSNVDPNCGSVLAYFDKTIETFPSCPGSIKIERTWQIFYENNPDDIVTCIQIIELNDDQAPSISCPNNITLTGGNTAATWDAPSYTDNCGATLSGTHTSGSSFPEGCTTVTYTAQDNCGNATSCSFEVCVDNNCSGAPSITCPADYFGCAGSSTDSSVTGNASVSTDSNACGQVILTHIDEVVENYSCSGAMRIKRTWKSYYLNNPSQTDECVQFITLNDTAAPTVTNCPGNISGTTGETISWTEPTFADDCTFTVIQSHFSGTTFSEGCTTVTYTATDGCGNTVSCSFEVCISSACNSVPEIECPADFVGCPDSSIDPSITGNLAILSSSSICGSIIICHDDTVLEEFPCNGSKKIERRWKAVYSENEDNPVYCYQIITLQDEQDPVITNCPADITASEGSVVSWTPPTFSDNCNYTVSSTHSSGTTFPIGCTTVTYTVTDGCGAVATCSFNVCIDAVCNGVPSLSCPSDYNACPGSSTEPSVTGQASVSGNAANCGQVILNYVDEVTNINCNDSKRIERTWSAYYAENPSQVVTCVQIIELSDTQAPTITNCPVDISANEGETIHWASPDFADNCSYTVSSTHNSGSTFPVGCTTVTYTVTDGCGATASCSFEVCVTGVCDDVPSISCPNNIIACPGTSTNSSVTGQPAVTSSSDNCGQVITEFNDEILETYNCTGAERIRRTWTAYHADNSSNSASCTQIIDLNDTQAPSVNNCPTNISVLEGDVVTWSDPSFSDNCSFNVNVSHNSGSTFPIGCTTVTYTASDPCGNTSSCSFEVCVSRTCEDRPSISCPSVFRGCAIDTDNPEITGYPTTSGDATGCGDIVVTFTDMFTEDYSAECAGSKKVVRMWYAAYENNPLFTSSCIQVVDLHDKQRPTLHNCPDNISINGGDQAVTWEEPRTTDNCGSDGLVLSSTHFSGDVFSVGCTTVTYTSTDACGNERSCSFEVCLAAGCNDTPELTCTSDYFGCPGDSIDPSNTGTPTVSNGTSACGSHTLTYTDEVVQTYAGCNNARRIIRTWTAEYENNSGSSVICMQTIDLRDQIDPQLTNCPANITLAEGDDVATWTSPSATDNCSSVSISSTHSSGSTFSEGCTTVRYTAIDNCGNDTTCSFTVCVESACTSVPIIQCPADYVGCPGGSIDPSVTGNPTVTSTNIECGSIVTYFDEILEEYANCPGGRRIQRTWSASYSENSGQAATCIQIIDLRDTQRPSLSCPSNINLVGGDNVATWSTPTATDNCGTSLSSTHSSGATFPEGCTTVTYTANDNCGNTRTCNFTVCVEDACDAVPIIECPADYVGCPGGSIDPSVTGHPTVTSTDIECGSIVTFFDQVLEEYANCPGGRRIQRTWSASYSENSGQAATCIQIIDLRDTQAPSLTCPTNINLVGGETVATWTTPSATDNCGATLSSTHSSGASFPIGCTTVTYTADDNCGNTRTCNFTVCVEQGCTAVPIIQCPADYNGCPGTSIDPSVTGNPTVTTTSTECGSIVTYFDEILEEYDNCNGGRRIQRTWIASYTENPNVEATCIQIIDLNDTQDPTLSCPADILLTGGETVATWTTPAVSDNCSVSLSSTHSSGSTFPAGCTVVTYTATDDCGNVATCSFEVCVEDGGIGNVGVECVEDMVIACSDNGGAIAHWDIPSVDVNCNACTENQISGFIYMGTYNGHQYYCSNDPAVWTKAQANCAANGGHLAVINDAGENTFLANQLTIQSAYIGGSDANSEGNFSWVNGDAFNYSKWYPGQPNNYNNNQHYLELLSNGQWNDQYTHVPLEYIMEIPCASMIQTGGPAFGSQITAGCYDIEYTYQDACNNFGQCSFEVCVEAALTLECVKDVTITCPNSDNGIIVNWEEPQVTTCCTNCGPNGSLQIDGFLYMGSYGGSNYYCSNDKALWPDAKKSCQKYGGNLASISSAEENEFLANILTIQSAYIGLSDAETESYTWCDGSPLTYTNWYPGQPNNYNNNQDYCEMLSNGQWNDQYNDKPLEYIMEIPSCIDIVKTAGPANGSFFPVGTTTVAYEATDACGYKDDCTFNITVAKSGCVSGGRDASQAWVKQVEFADIAHTTGNDGGYANYTNVCGIINAGSTYALKLTPGFPSGTATVYWKVYIDFNNDGDYTDSGEYIATGSGFQTLSGNIAIPTNIWNVTTSMRVVMRKGGPPAGPCDIFSYGETEDYCIRVTGAEFDEGDYVTESRSNDDHANVARLIAEEFLTLDLIDGAEVEVSAENTIAEDEAFENNLQLSNKFNISVYPNPASDWVNIHNLTPNKVRSVEIVNIQGQIVHTENGDLFEDRDRKINITGLTTGMYLIKVIDETGQRVSKKLSVSRF